VFGLAVGEAAQRGGLSLILVGLRELRDMPGAIILEHWREGTEERMVTGRHSSVTNEPGSRCEAMARMAPFLLLGVLPTSLHLLRLYAIAVAPSWSAYAITLGLLGLSAGLSVVAAVNRFPRRSLPNIGLPLAVLSVYGFSELLPGLRRALMTRRDPWFVRQIAYQGQLWIGLLAVGLLMALVTRVLSPLRPFYRRLRRDGTLLPFSLYGAALLALSLTFDDYVGDRPYKIVAVLLLAVGAWFYMRSARPWRRLLALFAGLTSAMAVAAAGKAILYANPGWHHSGLFTPRSEAMSTVIMWGWLVPAIFAPALLVLMPRSDAHPYAEETAV